MTTTWHGTEAEQYEMARAAEHNCGGCGEDNTTVCAVHHSMDYDQRWMDRLVFERRNVRALLLEEWCIRES